jgi:hypothetical protein
MLQAIMIIPSSQICLPMPQNLRYVCQSTCVTARESLKTLFASEQCSQNPNTVSKQYREDILAIYDNMCQTLATVNQNTCMTAVQSELYTCGYPSIDEGVTYCATTNDSCCSSVPGAVFNGTNMSNATVSSTSDNFFKSTTFFIILGIALGLFVMFIILIICLRRRKKRVKQYVLPKTSTKNSYAPTIASKVSPVMSMKSPKMTNSGETYVVKFAYSPALLDELALNPGDHVNIFEVFDDGWAMGKNMNTKKEGIFPMASVAPANSNSSNMTKKSPDFRASSLYGRYKQNA